jgi:8-oxo-dGTP diphosphatase
MIKVVCGIIYFNGNILVCRRNANKDLGGFWEFPGGKIEPDEKPEIALKRELLEELSIYVDKVKYFSSIIHSYKSTSIELIAYTCELQKGSIKLTDHDKVEWITPDVFPDLKLAPADIPIMERLVGLAM